MKTKKALLWVGFWLVFAMCFNMGIYFFKGPSKAIEFLGGYVIEQSLSIDNLFLFLIIFNSFGLPPVHQRRILNYGIAGAIMLRLIFVLLGVTIVNLFHWVLYIFGIILIISGVKMFGKQKSHRDFKENTLIRLMSKIIPFTDKLEDGRFFVKKDRLIYATPLLAALIIIEASDIVFAIDSVPAIFSITTDPFIVYTSNIFAILGLRSMYFVLNRLQSMFRFVKYGVAAVLIFTGIKLSILYFHIEISLFQSLSIIFSIMLISIIASISGDHRA